VRGVRAWPTSAMLVVPTVRGSRAREALPSPCSSAVALFPFSQLGLGRWCRLVKLMRRFTPSGVRLERTPFATDIFVAASSFPS